MPKRRFIIEDEGSIKEVPLIDEEAQQKEQWTEELERQRAVLKQGAGLPVEEQNRLWKRINELEGKLGLKPKPKDPPTGVYL